MGPQAKDIYKYKERMGGVRERLEREVFRMRTSGPPHPGLGCLAPSLGPGVEWDVLGSFFLGGREAVLHSPSPQVQS